MKSNVNLHIHTTHSDGKNSIAEIIDALNAAGVEYFSITDHDKMSGNIEAAELAKKHGLNFCNGIEMSCCFDGELGFISSDSCHILGFGIDIEKVKTELLKIKAEKAEKLRERSIPKIIEGIRIIRESGGIAIWAHPFEVIRTIKDNSSVRYEKEDLTEEYVTAMAKCMCDYGMDGIEAYYQQYTIFQIRHLEKIADEHNFLKSCGTDFHGKDGEQIYFEKNGLIPAISVMTKLFTEPTEIILKGGRSTDGVVRIGETVRRPHKPTSDFVNEILTFLHNNGFINCPKHMGTDEYDRDTYSYIDGFIPDDIGNTTIEQLCSFMKIVRKFHDVSSIFTNSADKVLCHNDLSPCNTVFCGNEPFAIIDWDNVAVGERWEDLTYIVWLWINIGSHKRNNIDIIEKLQKALFAYNADISIKTDFANKLLWRMDKVLTETPQTSQFYSKVKDWVEFSKLWVIENEADIKKSIG